MKANPHLAAAGAVLFTFLSSLAFAADPAPAIKPSGNDGRALNLDFEDGTLRDWTATGQAFNKQPVRGDTVVKRRGDMKSQHQGDYWIGGYEIVGDDPQGTLTSVSFNVTHPWASFLIGGGNWPNTRVELLRADTQQVFFKASGAESENLRPVVVDLQSHVGKEIFVRIVDQQSGHWGHVNFDHFVFHSAEPKFSDALDPKKGAAAIPPAADIVPFAGLSPDDAVKNATLPPGFKMHVFAAEPEIVQPIAFCLDDRGRVWVAEGKTYPRRRGNPPPDTRPAGPERSKPTPEQLKDILGGADRILVLEDTDGDHKADKKTVFLENMNLISGLQIGFGGVWVGAAPYLMFVPVSDWDNPKPAGDPKILLDGWNYTADTHETLNTFTWGPDGWLYGCHGVFCPSNVGKPGAPERERQWMDAGVWRYHPTKHVFEVFTEGGSNPWGIDFDEHGQLFAEMCVIPHFWHMIQGARIQRQGGEHFSIDREEVARNEKSRDARSRKPLFPYVYEDIKQHADHVHWAGGGGPHAGNARSDSAGGGHAHAGVMCYLGESWPSEYRGQLFIGNIHGQRLNVDIPVREGSGYVGQHGKDFLNFNDTWSQTLNQLYDQDGSVYVIDWYDKNQCHHNREDGHDRSNGRIYKIVYNEQRVTHVDLAKLSDDELVKQVPSKNEWMSRHARRLLQERTQNRMGALADDPALREKLMSRTTDTATKLRALWALHVTGSLNPLTRSECLKSSDEWVRAWTIQLGSEGKEKLELLNLDQLAKTDPSPLVRSFIATAAQRIGNPEFRARVVGPLLTHAEDVNDHNLPLMYWYAAEACVASNSSLGLELLKTCKIPKVREFIIRRLATMSLTSAQ